MRHIFSFLYFFLYFLGNTCTIIFYTRVYVYNRPLKNNCESPEIKTVIIAKNNIGFLAVGFYFVFTLDFYK